MALIGMVATGKIKDQTDKHFCQLSKTLLTYRAKISANAFGGEVVVFISAFGLC